MATQEFLLLTISSYQWVPWKQIREFYTRHLSFDAAFVSWAEILLDHLNLSNFISLDPVPPKTTIIYLCLIPKDEKWLTWRKLFERFTNITKFYSRFNKSVVFFQLVSILGQVGSKFKRFFTEEIEISSQHMYMYIYIYMCVCVTYVYAPIYS